MLISCLGNENSDVFPNCSSEDSFDGLCFIVVGLVDRFVLYFHGKPLYFFLQLIKFIVFKKNIDFIERIQ